MNQTTLIESKENSSYAKILYVLECIKNRYGKEFYNKFPMKREIIEKVWYNDLKDLYDFEINEGIKKLVHVPYVPSSPSFRLLCRPLPDYEAFFEDAARNMPLWYDRLDRFKFPASYWAARAFGRDYLYYEYSQVKKRWNPCVDSVLHKIRIGEIENSVPIRPKSLKIERNIEYGIYMLTQIKESLKKGRLKPFLKDSESIENNG